MHVSTNLSDLIKILELALNEGALELFTTDRN